MRARTCSVVRSTTATVWSSFDSASSVDDGACAKAAVEIETAISSQPAPRNKVFVPRISFLLISGELVYNALPAAAPEDQAH